LEIGNEEWEKPCLIFAQPGEKSAGMLKLQESHNYLRPEAEKAFGLRKNRAL
jgi:hypothetical protein